MTGKNSPVRFFQHLRNLGMTALIIPFTPIIAAAGPAFLVWLFGGGFGLALVVFIVLKMIGK